MNVGFGLLLMCALCAMIGIYRALINRRDDRRSALSPSAPVPTPQRNASSRVVWLSATEFLKLIESDPDTVVFRLTDGTNCGTHNTIVRGELVVTVQRFKDTLRWIPLGTQPVLYRSGGIDAAIARRLAAAARGRVLRLVGERFPLPVENFVAGGGNACK